MEKYPVLKLIVRYGQAAAVALALLVLGLGLFIGGQAWGWPAIPLAILLALVVFVLAKSYVELVLLVTDMLVPR